MPRTAYVHIGTHKTGTTYLQSWMRKNANTLAQLGIVYPDIGLTPKGAAHKVLALEARTAPDTLSETESWAQLADIVAETSGDVVISSETFSDRMKAPEHVRRLVHFFADLGLQTKFIIFLRDPPAYLNSLYVQAVKMFRRSNALMRAALLRTTPKNTLAHGGRTLFQLKPCSTATPPNKSWSFPLSVLSLWSKQWWMAISARAGLSCGAGRTASSKKRRVCFRHKPETESVLTSPLFPVCAVRYLRSLIGARAGKCKNANFSLASSHALA